MRDKAIVVLFSVGCLTAIVMAALYMGIDGTIYTPAILGIGMLVGFLFGIGVKKESQKE